MKWFFTIIMFSIATTSNAAEIPLPHGWHELTLEHLEKAVQEKLLAGKGSYDDEFIGMVEYRKTLPNNGLKAYGDFDGNGYPDVIWRMINDGDNEICKEFFTFTFQKRTAMHIEGDEVGCKYGGEVLTAKPKAIITADQQEAFCDCGCDQGIECYEIKPAGDMVEFLTPGKGSALGYWEKDGYMKDPYKIKWITTGD
jgi:hypothetical protein